MYKIWCNDKSNGCLTNIHITAWSRNEAIRKFNDNYAKKYEFVSAK